MTSALLFCYYGFMDNLPELPLLLTAGIFLLAFLAFLLSGVNALLNAKIEPLKDNQVRLEVEIKEIKSEQKEIMAEQKEIMAEQKEITAKLDQLLAKS